MRVPATVVAVLSMMPLLAGGPAWAASVRAWVSGHGVDQADCGAPTAPCRSLQYAHDNAVTAGGEIDILDPAGYGALTITKAVSIVNDGVGTAGVQATTGNAINVNAGPGDNVTLRGLNIDGLGAASTGIAFNAGASLTVVNCVIRHFALTSNFLTGDGILIDPSSGSVSFLISNVILANNGFYGLTVLPGPSPTIKGSIDHVISANNLGGFYADAGQTAGVTLAISNSVAANNTSSGVEAKAENSATDIISIDNSELTGNAYGVFASGSPSVVIGRTVVTANSVDGIHVGSTPVFTLGDNGVYANVKDVEGTLTSLARQ